MCLNPMSVPNPLYKRRGYGSQFGEVVELPSRLSPTSEFITVPCGTCVECRDTYFNSLLQRAICESRSSYMYFVTLTYDDKHIPFIDLDDERILYVDYSHVQNMVKRLRNLNILDRDFRYLSVNEYGDTYSRPHVHMLFFVAKKEGDSSNTPYDIERLLYDNLKLLFAQNVGTRKNPKYEPLFTFCQRWTSQGLRSNYWVEYVKPDSEFEYLAPLSESSYIKTVRYLIGYVNTSSRLDVSLDKWISCHNYDSILVDRVKRLLSNRVRFSKGFGCGFEDGKKFYLPKISCRASSNLLHYSNLLDTLPSDYDEFCELYPQLYDQVINWIEKDVYSNYSSLSECMKHFCVDDYNLHCLMLKYFGKQFSVHYRNLYKDDFSPTITAYFNLCNPGGYSIKSVKTMTPVRSELYNFLRCGVEDGISARVPFIAFPIKSQQGFSALCKYYRDRVCTFDDILRMYESVGVDNYDDWRKLFIESYNTRKRDKSKGNEQKYAENKEIILQKQKKSLHLLQKSAPNLFFVLWRD